MWQALYATLATRGFWHLSFLTKAWAIWLKWSSMEKLSLVSYFCVDIVNFTLFISSVLNHIQVRENINIYQWKGSNLFHLLFYYLTRFLPRLGYLSPRIQSNVVYSIEIVWEEMANVQLIYYHSTVIPNILVLHCSIGSNIVLQKLFDKIILKVEERRNNIKHSKIKWYLLGSNCWNSEDLH